MFVAKNVNKCSSTEMSTMVKKIRRNSEGIKIHSYNMFFDDTLR